MLSDGKEFFIKDPKTSFIVGIVAGVGGLATIGFILLAMNFFGDGIDLKKNSNGGSNNNNIAAPTPNNPSVKQNARNLRRSSSRSLSSFF